MYQQQEICWVCTICNIYYLLLSIHPQTLSKVIRQESMIREQAQAIIKRELEEETYERLKKIKKSILEPLPAVGPSFPTGNQELRKKYASMSAAELVLVVFKNAQEVFSAKMAWVSVWRVLNGYAVIRGQIY